MARQEIIELNIKADQAISEVQDLKTEIGELQEEIKQSSKKSEKGFEGVTKATRGLATGLKGVGLALKAAGIGLVIAAFNTLKEVMLSNQTAVDAFDTAIEGAKIGFSKFADKFNDDSDSMFATWDTFVDSITSGAKKIKNNLIDQVTGQFEMMGGMFKKIILEMRIAFNEWTGDQEESLQLQKDLEAANKQILDGYKKMANAVNEANNAIKDGVDDIIESTKETYEQARANVELAKQAEIAAIKQQGLIEKYDRQAELQRQIRDNEFKSIEERIKANDDLKEVLDKQEKAMLEQVNIQIKQAQTQYDLNQNHENYIKLLETRNEKQAVLAQIEGFRSEQDTNANALMKEKIELEQTVIDGINERTIAERQATDELIEDNYKRLQAQRKTLDFEIGIEVERLTKKRELYDQGTQAYIDANEELLNYKSEANIRAEEIDNEMRQIETANSNKSIEQSRKEAQAKIQAQVTTLNAASQALGSLVELAGEGTKVGKAAAIAQILIDTASGISSAIAGATAAAAATGPAAPVVTPLLIVQLVGQVLAGMASAKAILGKVEGPEANIPSSISTGSGGGGIQSQAPAFNVVGQSGFNQVAMALGQQQPVQAYVVAGDVTTAQQLDNNIIQTATF
tara:strand:- start:415 stop:2298 length:1884 start_codon:yes stop_codon:yes gene_type:complete